MGLAAWVGAAGAQMSASPQAERLHRVQARVRAGAGRLGLGIRPDQDQHAVHVSTRREGGLAEPPPPWGPLTAPHLPGMSRASGAGRTVRSGRR